MIWFDNVIRCSINYPGTFDFQVVLHESGGFDINYRTMEGNVTSATIGMQNDTGLDGLQIVFNVFKSENGIKSNDALIKHH